MDIHRMIAQELDITSQQVARTVDLFDDGNTVPFISRYRKEVTGELDETQIRAIEERLAYLRALQTRKETVLKSIAQQGKLTPELETTIRQTTVRQEVEDLYLPYRPKRRTRATVAREQGLQPLADLILAQKETTGTLRDYARPFLSAQVPTVEDAYAGARDIVAEVVAENANVRKAVRSRTLRDAVLTSAQTGQDADPQKKYQMYYDFQERLAGIPAHRLLAINRGESEGALKVKIAAPAEAIEPILKRNYLSNPRSVFADQARQALLEAYKHRIAPSIERELRATRTEQADEEAIQIFATNLRSLLLQPPIRGRVVMGIDPGYRTGCKVTIVDATSRFVKGTTIYPHAPQNRWEETKRILTDLIIEHEVQIIAIGNGTASRESETLAAQVIGECASQGPNTQYIMVSEAGASVYSASELAREELPDLDVTMRGAVSIARRLQDPLAELVKIDPKSIGVGLYQHDVDQKRLVQALGAVVESAVNYVGVDLNTASSALLSYVAGVNHSIASNIVAYRNENGPFRTRSQLKKVKRLGNKAFEQAAGFLRIPDATNLLDNTAIHPESYPVVKSLFAHMGIRGNEPDMRHRLTALGQRPDLSQFARQLGVGMPTLRDIVDALQKPGRDPRQDLPLPILRQDVLKIKDLTEGMILQGTVRNVVPFGAFVDIGVKQDGLVHISQLADRYVRDPLEIVSTGDIVQVRVLGIDLDRGRIALTIKSP